MSKELCFIIEEKELYMEQVLVDYMDVPIFFLCKDKSQYYIVLCVDIEERHYIVAELSLADTYNLLHGKLSMRDSILKQNYYWMIESGEEICLDIVTKHKISDIDHSLLPEENACFEILTEEIKGYVQSFDEKYLKEKYFFDYNETINIFGNIEIAFGENLFTNLNGIFKVFECKMEETISSKVSLYNEEMMNIGDNSKKIDQKEIKPAFELKETLVNHIATAA